MPGFLEVVWGPIDEMDWLVGMWEEERVDKDFVLCDALFVGGR